MYQYINLEASNSVCCYVNNIFVETSIKKRIEPEYARGTNKIVHLYCLVWTPALQPIDVLIQPATCGPNTRLCGKGNCK